MALLTPEHRVERALQLVSISGHLVVVSLFLVFPLSDANRWVATVAILAAAAGVVGGYLTFESPSGRRIRRWTNLLQVVATGAIIWAGGPFSVFLQWLWLPTLISAAWQTSRRQWQALTAVALVMNISTILGLTISGTTVHWVFVIMSAATVLAMSILARALAATLAGVLVSHRRLALKVEEAHRADRDKTEILSLVTHQLKTPLALIRWSTESVLADNKRLSAKEHERLEQVISTTQSMYRTIEDLSHVFKLTSKGSGKFLKWEEVTIDDLLKQLVSEYSLVANERGITLHSQVARTPTKVRADKVLLKQAIANLIDNAIKYSYDKSSVEILLKKERGEAILTVTDHGIGIEPANLERIFERFFRADRAKQHNEHGTGLGLYLVHMIIRRLKGVVTVASQVGKGTTFTMTLPLES